MNRMRASPLIARALDVAEKRIGLAELCQKLAVPEATIRAWRFGHTAMPEYKFHQLVDILTDLDVSWTEWDEFKPPK